MVRGLGVVRGVNFCQPGVNFCQCGVNLCQPGVNPCQGLVAAGGGVGRGFGVGEFGVGVVGVVCGGGGFEAVAGGGAEVAQGGAVFGEGGADGALVDVDEAGDLFGWQDFVERADLSVVVEGEEAFEFAEGVFAEQLVEALFEALGVVEQFVVGEGLDELGALGFEGAEVVVDGGAGELETLGDLAEGEALLAELVGLEGASSSLGGEGHGGGTSVLL